MHDRSDLAGGVFVSPREALLALLLASALASLYIAEPQIGPLWSIAVAVLIAGEALVSVIDDVFPRTGSSRARPRLRDGEPSYDPSTAQEERGQQTLEHESSGGEGGVQPRT